MDALWAKRPHTLIDASVWKWMPDRQMGNSKWATLTRAQAASVYQDLTRLDVEIKNVLSLPLTQS